VYDQLVKLKGEDFVKNSLEHQEVMGAVLNEVTQEMERAYFPFHIVKGEELESLLSDVRQLWRSEEGTQEWLQELENDHRQYQNRREQSRKKRK
jgi:CRISPR-associated protein Csc2